MFTDVLKEITDRYYRENNTFDRFFPIEDDSRFLAEMTPGNKGFREGIE